VRIGLVEGLSIDRKLLTCTVAGGMNIAATSLRSARARSFLFTVVLGWLLCLAAGLAVAKDPTFTGSWDTLPDENRSFSLDLVQTGNDVAGYHDAVSQHGNRIDSATAKDGPPTIVGSVKHGIAHVTLKSGDESGQATITIKGDTMEWKMTKSDGVYIVPQKAVLFRNKKKQT
jgi:hypothetical protein